MKTMTVLSLKRGMMISNRGSQCIRGLKSHHLSVLCEIPERLSKDRQRTGDVNSYSHPRFNAQLTAVFGLFYADLLRDVFHQFLSVTDYAHKLTRA